LVTSQEGNIWPIKKADGVPGAQSSINNPLRSGTLKFNNKILLTGSDGTIHVVPMGGGN
jgi:hypothetical protein